MRCVLILYPVPLIVQLAGRWTVGWPAHSSCCRAAKKATAEHIWKGRKKTKGSTPFWEISVCYMSKQSKRLRKPPKNLNFNLFLPFFVLSLFFLGQRAAVPFKSSSRLHCKFYVGHSLLMTLQRTMDDFIMNQHGAARLFPPPVHIGLARG